MSIVERALKKMQGADVAPRPANQVFGKVIETPRQGVAVAPLPASPPVPAAPSRSVSINQAALRAAGLLPPEHQERQIANQYRRIKRPLLASALGRGQPRMPNGQLIMVASSRPGEGKTFTSINLAFSIALEKDVRAVLVDADVAKPQISNMFGIAAEKGLLDLLTDPHLDPERLILPTNVPNLFVLPAGTRTDNATELLASERMVRAMQQITNRDASRIVLFDSPPILLTTESQVLAQVAGQIVVVVQAEKTPQDVLLDALSYLPEGANVSLILNQSLSNEDAGYYYGYGIAADHDSDKNE